MENKQWWQRKRIQGFAAATLAAIAVIFFIWWGFYRFYVSTNDARIATSILRLSPVGVGGVIEKVLVAEGDTVKVGQLLVEIDRRVPEAQVKKAKARLRLTQAELNRAKSLVENNFSPTRDLENAKANYEIAASELKLAEVALQNTYLKSPIDGIVIQKLAETGNVLEPGQVAIAISDAAHAWVSANIEETRIAQVKPGQPVLISIDEGGTLTGQVEEVGAATASQFSLLPAENAAGNFTKVVQKIPVKVSLDPHPGRILRAGQSVTIKIKVR
jgi:membrane fusion protein (multidrug efflux system)